MFELLNCVQDVIADVSHEVCETVDGTVVERLYTEDSFIPVLVYAPFDYGPNWYTELAADASQSFGVVMANFGWDLYIVDDRRVTFPPGTCEADPAACAFGGTLSMADRVDDGLAVLDVIEDQYGPGRALVGGYVGGAIAAAALANEAPGRIDGLWLWNGTTVGSPTTQAYNAFGCGLLDVFLASGTNVLPGGALPALFAGFQADPDGPPFIPPQVFGLAGPFTAEELFYRVMTTHVDNPQWPTPDFRFFTGSAEEGLVGVFPSDPFERVEFDTVFKIGNIAGTYTSVGMLRDIICGIAGDDTYSNNIGAYDGDVIMLGSSAGFGPDMEVLASQMPNANVVTNFIDAAESDRYFSNARFFLADLGLAIWSYTVAF